MAACLGQLKRSRLGCAVSQSRIFAFAFSLCCWQTSATGEFYFAEAELINEQYSASVKSSAYVHLCANETVCGCNRL